MTVNRLPISEARNTLGQIAKRAHINKEMFLIENAGIPLAYIVDVDEMEDYLELRDPHVRAIIAKGHQEYLAGKARPASELLGELEMESGKRVRRRSSKHAKV